MKQQAGAPRRLVDKVAVVTGAGGTNSIGRSIALRLAAEGAKVGVVDVDVTRAALVADAIRSEGGQALPLACDVSLAEDCQAAAVCVANAFGGRLDILVNNAATFRGPSGPYHPRPFEEWTNDQFDHMLDVNLKGMWLCARAALPYMKAQRYGKIVNVASSTFWEGAPGLVPYVATKGGVIGFTRSLAAALGPDGIRVNCLAPGYTLTAANLEQSGDGSFAEQIRLSRCLTERDQVADDLAGPAFYLASPDSDFMTGQTLLIDGGLNFN